MSSLTEDVYPTTARVQSLNAAKDILCGSVAGSVAKVAEYPFDTVKVRLQSQPHTLPPRYAGPLDCLRQSLAHDGVKGMYRGVSAPLLGAAAEMASIFMSYALAQNILKATLWTDTDVLPLSALVTCGAMSGAVTSLVLNPIELLKCKMQVQSLGPDGPAAAGPASGPRPGPAALIASIYRHHGILGFWYGQTGTLFREVGGTAAYFGSYESVSAAFRRWNAQRRGHDGAVVVGDNSDSDSDSSSAQLPVYQRLLAGASAGMAYNFLFYPADTIKSTMQTDPVAASSSSSSSSSFSSDGGPGAGAGARAPRRTFWDVGAQIWRAHGVRGFYRGCGLTVCRSAPASALIFTIYETMRDAMA